MALADYLRDQAEQFRELARRETDPNIRRQLFSLAMRCEVALTIVEGPTFKRRQQG